MLLILVENFDGCVPLCYLFKKNFFGGVGDGGGIVFRKFYFFRSRRDGRKFFFKFKIFCNYTFRNFGTMRRLSRGSVHFIFIIYNKMLAGFDVKF